MVRDKFTRRRVLRTGGELAAVGAITSTAGCLDDIPIIGGPALAPGDWVAAPDVFTGDDHGFFSYVDIATLVENEDELSDSLQQNLDEENELEQATGLDSDDVKVSLNYSSVTVSEADFNKDDLIAELEDNDFDDETEHEGYTIMLAADDSDFAGRAIGVSDNRIISGQPTEEEDAPEDVVEIAIDVGNGNEDRYVDQNDDFDELLSTMSIGTIAFGNTQEEAEETNTDFGQFEGEVASSSSYTVNGSTTDVEFVWVFDRDGDVDTGDIEDYIENSQDGDGFWSNVDDVEVNQNGRTATATGQMDTDELFAE